MGGKPGVWKGLNSPYSFFFFNLFIYFNWRLITLQYCGGFCHTLTWISHGCTCVSHPGPPSHLPHHSIPQGCPSTSVLSSVFHASTLDWWSISHMVIYVFQCHSLKSSHPRLFPQSPKVCSLSLCLFCCLAYKSVSSIAQSCWTPHDPMNRSTPGLPVHHQLPVTSF